MPPPGLLSYCQALTAETWGQRMDYGNRLGVSELLYRQCEPWHARLAAVETRLTDYGGRVSAFLAELGTGTVDRFEDLLAECQSLTQELRTLARRVSNIEDHILRLDIAERRRTLEWEAYDPPPNIPGPDGRGPSLFEQIFQAQREARNLRSPASTAVWTPDHLRYSQPSAIAKQLPCSLCATSVVLEHNRLVMLATAHCFLRVFNTWMRPNGTLLVFWPALSPSWMRTGIYE